MESLPSFTAFTFVCRQPVPDILHAEESAIGDSHTIGFGIVRVRRCVADTSNRCDFKYGSCRDANPIDGHYDLRCHSHLQLLENFKYRRCQKICHSRLKNGMVAVSSGERYDSHWPRIVDGKFSNTRARFWNLRLDRLCSIIPVRSIRSSLVDAVLAQGSTTSGTNQ